MMIASRFAPSPTGYLHVGNLRTALVNYLLTRRLGGRFWLRIDDTDKERSEERFVMAIMEDLEWMGVTWDGMFRQSEREPLYEEVRRMLVESGRLYPCYETKEELDMQRKMLQSRHLPPVYNRAALGLTLEQKQRHEKEGRRPHYRFRLAEGTIGWQDGVRGEVSFDASHISDPIVIREDGTMTYLLCSAVDDRDYGITHIVRGEDHVTNTAVQIQMMEALGCSALPHFSHLALMTTREGELSKRTGGLSLRSLRAEGMDPMAIASGLARLGTSDPVIPQCSMQAIVDGFEIGHFGRAPTLYDPEQCLQWNRKILALRSFEDAVVACKRLGIEGLTETLWYAIRHNIERWTEVPLWLTLLETDLPIAVLLEEREYLSEALVHLPETLDGESWSVWTKRLQGITGRRGRGLFLPLRRALTGREDGPEMATLLTILPRALVVARLTQAMGAA